MTCTCASLYRSESGDQAVSLPGGGTTQGEGLEHRNTSSSLMWGTHILYVFKRGNMEEDIEDEGAMVALGLECFMSPLSGQNYSEDISDSRTILTVNFIRHI